MNYSYSLTLLFILSAFSFQEVKLPKSAMKKMDKVIRDTWDMETYNRIPISLSGLKEIKLEGAEKLYSVHSASGGSLGYMMLSNARGKFDYFDLMVLYNSQLEILNSSILVYREDIGGEIGSTRWLKQFIGKTISSEFKLDSDVQGISGATISVMAATREFKRLTTLMEKLNKQDKLNQ